MPLPKITAPSYEVSLPSSGKSIKYRPFLVKEEKVLMLASESENPKDIANAIKSILSACIVSRIKIEELSSFDIEFLFLNVRAKSVGEVLEITAPLPSDPNSTVKLEVNLQDVAVQFPEGHEKEIEIADDLTVVMKYPSMDMFIDMNFTDKEVDPFDVIGKCIDQIIQGDEIWEGSECSKKELTEFVESMTSEQFAKVNKFFETMPKLEHKVSVPNPETGELEEITLSGIGDFFG